MTTLPLITDERRGATSASNAQADANCPGRHLAQKGLKSPDTADSRHGKTVHEALKTGNTDGLTVEQRDIYDSCLAIENKLVTVLFPELATSKQTPKVWREQRFWVKIHGPASDNGSVVLEHSGQTDVVYRVGPKAAIFEYKTLAGDVAESPENLQLRDQAVLVSGNLLVQQIAVAVIQPLVTHSPQVCYYSGEDLKRSETDMFARVIASNDPKSGRVAGEVQCKFCLFKGKCLEYQKWAGAMVPNMLSLLDVPIEGWTPEQRGMFLDRRSVAQKWLDDCESRIKELLQKEPNSCRGWTLKPGAMRETITNPQGVFDRFCQLGGKAEEFLKCVSVTKAKLKEQLQKLTGARGAALDKSVKTLTDGMVEVKQTAPTLERAIDGQLPDNQ